MRALLPLLLLAACAAPAPLARNRAEPWLPVPDVPRLALAVSGCADPALCQDLRAALAAPLAADIAPRIVAASEPADLAVAVSVAEGPRPGLLPRAFGAVADAPRLQALVTVTDLRGPSPRTLRRFTAGSSPSAPRTAGRQDALATFAGTIADGLRF